MKTFARHIASRFLSIGILFTPVAGTFAQTVSRTSDSHSVLSTFVGMSSPQEHPFKCGFSVITSALSARDSLSAEMRTQLERLLQRPAMQKSFVLGHFRIHYDTVGENTPTLLDSLQNPIPGTSNAFADSAASIAEQVWRIQVGELGYVSPPQDNGAGGGNEYDIYIVKRLFDPDPLVAYGLTTPEVQTVPNGRTWTSFLKIHNDFTFVSPRKNRGLPALRVTLAHEFHHAIQIGGYGLWNDHEYFYEITSTWLEDVLFPEVNDYLQYLSDHFARPYEPFTKFEMASTIQYSRCIWGHYVAKRFGRDAMRRAWEGIQTAQPLQAMDNALRAAPYSSSFRQAFSEWILWNFFTNFRADTIQYYNEGQLYPRMTQTPVGFSPPARAITGTLSALAARYYQIAGLRDTLTLALPNVNFDAGVAGNTTAFPYTILLNNQAVDETYTPTPVGLYYKLDVPDPTNWVRPWAIVQGGVIPSTAPSGVPFPNPFFVDGRTNLYVPVSISRPASGFLSIFTSSMDLVLSATLTSVSPQPGQYAFTWNGRTNNGEIVKTGVYFFVLEVENQMLKGKIAVVRR